MSSNVNEFIRKNIIKSLTDSGLDQSIARECADLATEHFRRRSCNSRDPFGDVLKYAVEKAKKRSPGFKMKSKR